MITLAMVAGAAATGEAQRPTTAKPPEGTRICDMSLRVVTMRVVDRQGVAVPDAKVTMRRVRTRVEIAGAEAMSGGEYKLLVDGTIPDLRPGGEPFDVTFRKGARSRRVRVMIGLDEGGCHVRFVIEPKKVVL